MYTQAWAFCNINNFVICDCVLQSTTASWVLKGLYNTLSLICYYILYFVKPILARLNCTQVDNWLHNTASSHRRSDLRYFCTESPEAEFLDVIGTKVSLHSFLLAIHRIVQVDNWLHITASSHRRPDVRYFLHWTPWGRIFWRNWDKSLQSIPPCYSQSPLLTDSLPSPHPLSQSGLKLL